MTTEYDNFQLEELLKTFPIPGNVIPLTGIGGGYLVKFETFYLKVYDDQTTSAYVVEGYLYGENQLPTREFLIPYNQFREFSDQIRYDDYLQSPIIVTWLQPLPPYGGQGPRYNVP